MSPIHRESPLTPALSPWERGRPLNDCDLLPLPWGEGWGEGYGARDRSGGLSFPAVVVHPFDLEAMPAQTLHRSLGVGAVLRLD